MEIEQKIDSESTAEVSVHIRRKGLVRWVFSLLDFGSLQVPIIFTAILFNIELVLIIIMLLVAATKLIISFMLALKKNTYLGLSQKIYISPKF